MRPSGRYGQVLLLVTAVLIGPGCVWLAAAGGAAAGAGAAVFYLGRLEQTVDGSVEEVYQAALETLEAENLPVIEKKVDSMTARVESEYADEKHIWIQMEEVAPERTKVWVRVGIVGDKDRSSRLLDGIKSRL
ncbi:MAG: DUF3568 family protein [Candidatus Brocadiia bacterium]